MEFAIVFVSGNYSEAYMVASALDGHEIDAVVIDDEFCRIFPGAAFIVGGAKVLVEKGNKELAESVIALVYSGGPPYAGSFINVGVGGSDVGVFLAIPWLLRRNRLFEGIVSQSET